MLTCSSRYSNSPAANAAVIKVFGVTPNVVEFIELATRTEHRELQIEEIELVPDCALVGKSLKESDLHRKHGIYVVAIKKPFSGMIATPQADTTLEVGDILIALGNRTQLDVLEKMAK